MGSEHVFSKFRVVSFFGAKEVPRERLCVPATLSGKDAKWLEKYLQRMCASRKVAKVYTNTGRAIVLTH